MADSMASTVSITYWLSCQISNMNIRIKYFLWKFISIRKLEIQTNHWDLESQTSTSKIGNVNLNIEIDSNHFSETNFSSMMSPKSIYSICKLKVLYSIAQLHEIVQKCIQNVCWRRWGSSLKPHAKFNNPRTIGCANPPLGLNIISNVVTNI